MWRAGDGPIAAAGTAAHPRVSDRVPALERRPGIGDGARRQDAVEDAYFGENYHLFRSYVTTSSERSDAGRCMIA